MKKVILFLLISAGAFSQRNGLIDADTTKRPKSGLSALAFNNGSLRIVRNSGSSIGVGLLSATQTWTGINTFGGNSSLSSGTANIFSLTPTINQTGTAGYRGLFVSPFEQSVGSGSKLLLDLGTNSAANGAGVHTSKFNVDNSGLTTVIGAKIRIDNGQAYQIKNNSSSYLDILTVNGANSLYVGSGNTDLYFRANNTNPLYIASDGNIGIGTTVNAGFKLDVNGTARVQGQLTASTITDGFISISSAQINRASGNVEMQFQGASGIQFFGQTSFPSTFYADGRVRIGGTSNIGSAQFNVESTTRGFLPPRMTQTQRNAIASPATGLTLYCTDCTATDASTGVMQTYNGSTWKNNW